MQVYGLITNGEEFIIPKKAETNSLWGGRIQKETIVNQAGQYACFGGKFEHKDKEPIHTIFREIYEETGVTKDQLHDLVTDTKKFETSDYIYFIMRVPAKEFGKLVSKIEHNIKTGSVTDGEFQEVHIVPIEYLDIYLGHHEPISLTESDLKQTKKYSQSIDWYADIAKEVMSLGSDMQFRSLEDEKKSSDHSLDEGDLFIYQSGNKPALRGGKSFVDISEKDTVELSGADETDTSSF